MPTQSPAEHCPPLPPLPEPITALTLPPSRISPPASVGHLPSDTAPAPSPQPSIKLAPTASRPPPKTTNRKRACPPDESVTAVGMPTGVVQPSSQLGGMVVQVPTVGSPSTPSISDMSMSVGTQAAAVCESNTHVTTGRMCSKARGGQDAAAALTAVVSALNALLPVRRNPPPVSTMPCAYWRCCRLSLSSSSTLSASLSLWSWSLASSSLPLPRQRTQPKRLCTLCAYHR